MYMSVHLNGYVHLNVYVHPSNNSQGAYRALSGGSDGLLEGRRDQERQLTHPRPCRECGNINNKTVILILISIHNTRKVDVRLPGKGNSNSLGARPLGNSGRPGWSGGCELCTSAPPGSWTDSMRVTLTFFGGGDGSYSSQFKNNYFTEMCSGSEAGSYLRLIDFCITQL